jgi:hypothetical protein
MEFSISGNAIKSKSMSTKWALPPINRRPSVGKIKPETSPRALSSRERKPSSGGLIGTSINASKNPPLSRQNSRESRSREADASAPARSSGDKPAKMQRAKQWTPEVENLFRYQAAGFRDQNEYLSVNEQPEHWETGFVKCLNNKTTGYFMYFRQDRECEDKYLNKIKIYSY